MENGCEHKVGVESRAKTLVLMNKSPHPNAAKVFIIAAAVYNEAKAKGRGRELPTSWFLESLHP